MVEIAERIKMSDQESFAGAVGSAWVSVQERMPPNEAVIVRVARKPDAAIAGPRKWLMWACNVRMHTDEVGWWCRTTKLSECPKGGDI